MQTALAQRLGIEFPIFAFTHCRDVVVAVSRAGGFGVLGAVGFSPEQLESELRWIDEHIGDRPYGVDIVIPGKYEGQGEDDLSKLEDDLRAMIPDGHRTFVRKLLAEHGVPELPDGQAPPELLGWTAAGGANQVDVALRHPNMQLIANALGTPPPDVIAEIHGHGRLVAALCGAAAHAQHHVDAGVDIVIAQGGEGGGHTGDVGSIVLWPEVIRAVSPTPVLAAGGIASGDQIAAALAMGAEGVWTGSLWLTVAEADVPPVQQQALLEATSRDTVRSRSWTGKPCRMLRSEWTEAWATEGNPEPLGMPLQFMVTGEAVARGHQYPEQAKDIAFNPVGQTVGALTKVRPVRDVIYQLAEETAEAFARTARLAGGIAVE